jgi:acyl dehydratase
MATWEELVPVGKKFVSAGRTISEGTFTLLSDLTWTTGRAHTDKEYMKNTQFGERLLSGQLVLAIVMGLSMVSGMRQILYQDKVFPVGLLGYDDVRFPGPVLPGDTISAHSEITGIRPSRKNPKRGIIQCNCVAFNQRNQEVMSMKWAMLLEMTG